MASSCVQDEIQTDRNLADFSPHANAFGFIGWFCAKTLRTVLFLLPVSPYYSFLHTDWLLAIVGFLIVLAPYPLTMLLSDVLSSDKSINCVTIVSGVCVVTAFVVDMIFPETKLVLITLLSVSMWGCCFVWESYFAVQPNIFNLRGMRSIMTCALLMLISFLFSIDNLDFFLIILIVASLICSIVYRTLIPRSYSFSSKREAKKMPFNPLWATNKAFLSGIGVGCLFAAGITNNQVLFCVSLILLISGVFMAIDAEFLLSLKGREFLAVFIGLAMLVLLVAPYAEGSVLVAIGMLGMITGRTRLAYSLQESYNCYEPKVNFYATSRDQLCEISGLMIGVYACQYVFTTQPTMGKTVFFSAVLYLMIMCTILYCIRIIKKQEQAQWDYRPNIVQSMSDADFDVNVIRFSLSYKLSQRETEILQIISLGKNAEYVSKSFVISINTARTHIYNIYKKTHVHSQQELIDLLITKGVLPKP